MTEDTSPAPFISTIQLYRGWVAVKYRWVEKNVMGEGFWLTQSTGIGSYLDEPEAIAEAQRWAGDEDLEYVPRDKAFPGKKPLQQLLGEH